MDLSNKSLALLLIAAITISLGGTLISLNKIGEKQGEGFTGFASSGKVNVSVTSNVQCNVENNVSFGEGVAPASTITLSSDISNVVNGFADCSGTGITCQGIQLNNSGNTNLNITFTSSANGSQLALGAAATESSFQFFLRNGTQGNTEPGCKNNSNMQAWWPVNSSNWMIACTNLTANDTADMITFEYNMTIYSDVVTGVKSSIMYINCTASTGP